MKTLSEILIEQRQRRDNYEAARMLGIFKSDKDLETYHARAENIRNDEFKAVNKFIRSIRSKSND